MIDFLFPDVPRNKTRLEIFKESNSVRCVQEGELIRAVQFREGIEEARESATGETEEIACLELAKKLKLPLTLANSDDLTKLGETFGV